MDEGFGPMDPAGRPPSRSADHAARPGHAGDRTPVQLGSLSARRSGCGVQSAGGTAVRCHGGAVYEWQDDATAGDATCRCRYDRLIRRRHTACARPAGVFAADRDERGIAIPKTSWSCPDFRLPLAESAADLIFLFHEAIALRKIHATPVTQLLLVNANWFAIGFQIYRCRQEAR